MRCVSDREGVRTRPHTRHCTEHHSPGAVPPNRAPTTDANSSQSPQFHLRQALLLKSSTASRSPASRQTEFDFSSHIWRASKLLLLPLQHLVLRIEPSPSSSTIVLLFDMLFDDFHLAAACKAGAFTRERELREVGAGDPASAAADTVFDTHRFVTALESPPRVIRHADVLPFIFQLTPFCDSATQDLILRSLNHLVTGKTSRSNQVVCAVGDPPLLTLVLDCLSALGGKAGPEGSGPPSGRTEYEVNQLSEVSV